MSGIAAAFLGGSASGGGGGGGGGHLDTQSITTGGQGDPIDMSRERGWTSGLYGSITTGTSAIYGQPITIFAWYENGGVPFYQLTITGASNSGWTTVKIDTKTLNRVDASYSGGIWTWTTTDTISTQAFHGQSTSHTIYFD